MKFAFIAKHRGISLLKPPFRGGQPPKTGNCGQGHARPLRPYTLP
jgi:hypothetical protein